MKRASASLKSAIRQSRKSHAVRRERRSFPYEKVAKMWAENKTIQQIAHTIGYIDQDNPKDPYHSLRNFLYRMHKGYKDKNGDVVKLPHRISKSTLKAAKHAGLQAWNSKNRKARAERAAAKAQPKAAAKRVKAAKTLKALPAPTPEVVKTAAA